MLSKLKESNLGKKVILILFMTARDEKIGKKNVAGNIFFLMKKNLESFVRIMRGKIFNVFRSAAQRELWFEAKSTRFTHCFCLLNTFYSFGAHWVNFAPRQQSHVLICLISFSHHRKRCSSQIKGTRLMRKIRRKNEKIQGLNLWPLDHEASDLLLYYKYKITELSSGVKANF